MRATDSHRPSVPVTIRHEAFLYRGRGELVSGLATFVRESLAVREPVLLALPGDKGDELRDALRDDLEGRRDDVLFTDITEVGRNPGRLIPACRDFLLSRQESDKRVRMVGEPMWPGRSVAEAREVQRHEALLGSAFTGIDGCWLLCPYDVAALGAEVLEEAYRGHPFVLEGGLSRSNGRHEHGHEMPSHLDRALPEPPAGAVRVDFGRDELARLRHLVASWAEGQGMPDRRRQVLVLAVNELTTNSIEHGGGAGALLLWREGQDLVAEVRDAGHIAAPLVGRLRPDRRQGGGRGVWLVNQVCDLVEIRSGPTGTVARVHLAS